MGIISNIERYALNDGLGVRTTVFLKGCPLRCRWCCNPETQSFNKELTFFKDECIGCGMCARTCLYGAVIDGPEPDWKICADCYRREKSFACVEKCYPGCRKISGENQTSEEVLSIVKRDMKFYLRSGGGVTISGGEPMAQPEFLLELLKKLKESWINTAIETCGMGKREDYEKILPYTDMVFYDLKCMDGKKHEEWTGGSNEQIKSNFLYISALAKKYDTEIIVRTPIIPGFNDAEEDIRDICEFVKKAGSGVSGMELLPYHKLGRGKYKSLGRTYQLEDLLPPDEDKMDMLNNIIVSNNIACLKF